MRLQKLQSNPTSLGKLKTGYNDMLGTAEVTMLGRVVADPEVTDTAGGKVMKLRVAVNERRKNGEHASFYNVDVWNEKNQAALSKVKKGEPLLIFASMSTEQYEGKSGDKITATRLRMDKFRFLGGSKEEQSDNEPW